MADMVFWSDEKWLCFKVMVFTVFWSDPFTFSYWVFMAMSPWPQIRLAAVLQRLHRFCTEEVVCPVQVVIWQGRRTNTAFPWSQQGGSIWWQDGHKTPRQSNKEQENCGCYLRARSVAWCWTMSKSGVVPWSWESVGGHIWVITISFFWSKLLVYSI